MLNCMSTPSEAWCPAYLDTVFKAVAHAVVHKLVLIQTLDQKVAVHAHVLHRLKKGERTVRRDLYNKTTSSLPSTLCILFSIPPAHVCRFLLPLLSHIGTSIGSIARSLPQHDHRSHMLIRNTHSMIAPSKSRINGKQLRDHL